MKLGEIWRAGWPVPYILAILVFAYTARAEAGTGTAYFVRSQVTGSTVQCFYSYMTKTYITTVDYGYACPSTITIQTFP